MSKGASLDLVGKEVTEAEVAAGLGFGSVFDLRRWETEQGQALARAEEELRRAKNDADSFKWHGERMQRVLEKLKEHLPDTPENAEMRLAIGVVLGKDVDWGKKLTWLCPPRT
jgi:hypothetical protein